MFKWIKDLIDSNDGQGRKAKGCNCEKPGGYSGPAFSGNMTFGNTPPTRGSTYSCTMPADDTETDTEGEKTPFTVTMLMLNGTEIVRDKVVEWDFFEDKDTGRVNIGLTLEDGTQQELIFMRNQLIYVTTT
ncbi:MAG: hypothetical protein JHC33_02135 [Ignisphaera sp.]|nr:hypothetical protein [Ignisphaera sp.]